MEISMRPQGTEDWTKLRYLYDILSSRSSYRAAANHQGLSELMPAWLSYLPSPIYNFFSEHYCTVLAVCHC